MWALPDRKVFTLISEMKVIYPHLSYVLARPQSRDLRDKCKDQAGWLCEQATHGRRTVERARSSRSPRKSFAMRKQQRLERIGRQWLREQVALKFLTILRA